MRNAAPRERPRTAAAPRPSRRRNTDRSPASLGTAGLARAVRVVHVSPAGQVARRDMTATEEPLEIRLGGTPFAVVMRTPGADRELAAGFLLAERVIRGGADLAAIERHPDSPNVLEVTLAAPRAADLPQLLDERRQVTTGSSCGLCGRRTIASLRAEAPPINADWTIPARRVAGLAARLRAAQAAFDVTGGLHAAGLFDRAGRLVSSAEDVGRHNAVDKVVGRMLLQGALPLGERLLFVSGRTSFEILQKALLAGIPIVGAVSAPSSLAVELAEEAGITLLGFVRRGACNVYANGWRVLRSG